MFMLAPLYICCGIAGRIILGLCCCGCCCCELLLLAVLLLEELDVTTGELLDDLGKGAVGRLGMLVFGGRGL